MLRQDRWRKALLISVLFHCLVLTGVGWLGGSLLKAAHLPDYIEVEMISIADQRELVTSPASPPAVVPAKDTPCPAQDRSIIAEKPVVVTELSADTVVENATTQPAATAVAGGGSSAAGSSVQASVPAGGRAVAAPRLLHRTEPRYPEEARRAGAEGTVVVKIEIREDGHPGAIAVIRSSGLHSLDAAALQAIRTWRFVPAQEVESGRAVRCYTTVSIVFQLKA